MADEETFTVGGREMSGEEAEYWIGKIATMIFEIRMKLARSPRKRKTEKLLAEWGNLKSASPEADALADAWIRDVAAGIEPGSGEPPTPRQSATSRTIEALARMNLAAQGDEEFETSPQRDAALSAAIEVENMVRAGTAPQELVAAYTVAEGIAKGADEIGEMTGNEQAARENLAQNALTAGRWVADQME